MTGQKAITRRFPNLYQGILGPVNAHDGVGEILAHRAFQRGIARPDLAFIDIVVMPPGTSIGRHRHGDDEETYVVIHGSGLMFLAGQELRVQAGDVVANPPFGEHGLVNDMPDDIHLLVFQVGPDGFGATGER